jgi:formylmethanofuran dehydrogenase subunit E
MSDTKAVLRKLLSDHVGADNGITQAQLKDALGMGKSTLRSEIRRLREERQIPIANQRDGYYIIQDRDELQDYIAHINSEIESKRQTIEHTTDAFAGFDPSDVDVSPPDDDPQEATTTCHNCGETVPKSDWRYPADHDDPCCRQCYGQWLMNGKSFEGDA